MIRGSEKEKLGKGARKRGSGRVGIRRAGKGHWLGREKK
jgi:hypothetical protein